MAGPQTVWGIDVGKSALKALKLRIAADKTIDAVAAEYVEHAKIMTQPDADRDALWSAALEKFLSDNDISGDKIVISVPGQQTLSRFSKLPPLEQKKKIPDIVRYEADQQIPFDMDEVVWDYQTFQAPESPDIEVGIFAIKRELIRDHLQHFAPFDLEPLAVQTSPLAVYNMLHFDGLLGDGHLVVIDIGTDNTDLLVATEHSLWTRTIQVGGNNFTEALVKAFKLSFSKAETLKRTAATSKYARQIFQAMRPVFVDLVQELQRSIGFYTATHRDAELSKVVGIGSAFQLPGLQKYLQQNLQLPVEWLDKFKKIKMPETDGGSPGSFATAYGLAVQGLQQAEVTSTLLPPEIAKQVVWRKKRAFFAAAAACLLLAAGVIWFRKYSDANVLEQSASSASFRFNDEAGAQQFIETAAQQNLPPRRFAQEALAAAQAFQSEYNQLTSQGGEDQRKTEQIARLLENRAMWLKILYAIHKALPAQPAPLADATDGAEYVAALKKAGDAANRAQRPEMWIDSFKAVYTDKVDDETIPDEWETMRNVEQIKNDGGQPRPGFIITMRCRTPNADSGLFVKRTFINNLMNTGRQEKAGFYVDKVGLVSAKAGDESGQRSSGRTPPGGRGNYGGWDRDRSGPQPTPPPSQDTSKDPLTGEDISRDWEFLVTMDIVLQDLPEKPEQQGT